MNDYLLTIAIPTYNGANTIKNMFDRLLPQCTEEIEIIVSDNCSIDSTEEIVSCYSQKFPIRYIRNEKNIGPDANFLQCMRLANGKFTLLLSDDDILIENSLGKILYYLKKYPEVSLVYLDSVYFRDQYESIDKCIELQNTYPVLNDLYTNDRKEFMKYALRMWGFMSSFLFSTKRFLEIENPEAFFNTYWLQSYIHIKCVNKSEDMLGVIKGPIIAAGAYRGVNNFSAVVVDGINYKRMLDYAVKESNFDQKQLMDFWLWRVCLQGRTAIIKEKEAKVHRTSKLELYKLLWRFPYAWVNCFPFFLVPRWMIVIRSKLIHENNSATKRETNYV